MAHVKVRERGKKQFLFLTSKGSLNRLRIHAAQFEDDAKAQEFIDANAPDNPDFEWKVA